MGGSWAPAVDIYEKDGNIVLKAELPESIRMTSTFAWRTTSSRCAASASSTTR